MKDPVEEPSGLMVLHAWQEARGRMRLRVTSTTDISSGRSETRYARDVPEALRIVESWLAELGFPTGP